MTWLSTQYILGHTAKLVYEHVRKCEKFRDLPAQKNDSFSVLSFPRKLVSMRAFIAFFWLCKYIIKVSGNPWETCPFYASVNFPIPTPSFLHCCSGVQLFHFRIAIRSTFLEMETNVDCWGNNFKQKVTGWFWGIRFPMFLNSLLRFEVRAPRILNFQSLNVCKIARKDSSATKWVSKNLNGLDSQAYFRP